MTELGHVVFYVRNLGRSVAFYRDVVGLNVVGELFGGRAAMLTGGRTHHELLLIEIGDAPGPSRGRRLGLYHVGWKIGDSLDALRATKERIERAGVALDGASDHTVSQSLYLRDPDGNEVELYVGRPERGLAAYRRVDGGRRQTPSPVVRSPRNGCRKGKLGRARCLAGTGVAD